MVERGYLPLIIARGYGARGKASMLRDKLWRDFGLRRLYKLRGVGEGFFGALALWFGHRLNARKPEVVELRLALRCLLYNLRIRVRCSRSESGELNLIALMIYWTRPGSHKVKKNSSNPRIFINLIIPN